MFLVTPQVKFSRFDPIWTTLRMGQYVCTNKKEIDKLKREFRKAVQQIPEFNIAIDFFIDKKETISSLPPETALRQLLAGH